MNKANTNYNEISIFRGMTDTEISECMEYLDSKTKRYKKGSIILHAGDTTSNLGIVLDGSVTIESNDAWGNCTILSHVSLNGIFAETYALIKDEILLVDVRANENAEILFLNMSKIRENEISSPWNQKLLRNLLFISSNKNLTLSGRSFHTSPRTIRGKLLSYLNSISLKKHSREFDIPFDRQQLADYLNVDRTALSKELGKMKNENLIDYHKNHFIVHSEIS